ncbi:MAG: RNA polymerase factor sigma-54 [Stenotrophobium sp.]
MKPGLRLHVGQQMAMTPQLLQSIRLLQLSSLELEQEMRQALERNVMLEQDDEISADTTEDLIQVEADQVQLAQSTEAEVTGADVAASERVEADFDWSSAESWSGGEPAGEQSSVEDYTAAAPSHDIRVRALEQLRLSVGSAREARLVLAIVEAVDDNGYLETTLPQLMEEVQDSCPDVTLAEMEAALTRVQSVEPSGFGARSLSECLLLQLRDLPLATPGLVLAEAIAADGLEPLAARQYQQLREKFGADEGQMLAALDLIRALSAKPGADLGSAAQAVVPDLIVSGTAGAWKVELNTAVLPRVRVNSLYEGMLNSGRASHRGLREQLQEARWLVRGLEMRHDTLLRTARVVFQRQLGFLNDGEEGMVPLTLREVAEAIQMHESTVSRVTTNKYVQTPWGIYELKAFFPSHLNGVEGESSGTAVRAMIRRIVGTENAAAPLCDGAIAALLFRNGVKVARRTVAKYRESMAIAPVKQRRKTGPKAVLHIAV